MTSRRRCNPGPLFFCKIYAFMFSLQSIYLSNDLYGYMRLLTLICPSL
jgi:hypothetical protein